MKFQIAMWVMFISMVAGDVYAGRLTSYCTMAENSNEIVGVNVHERLPIASVSKVFTSLFAITQHPIRYKDDKGQWQFTKIQTQFYYTEVAKGLYDVHIKGSNEPYFSRESMQWLISKLNEDGVTRIRNLTFDENFKYLHETDRRFYVGKKLVNPVSGKDEVDSPDTALVKAQLLQKGIILKNYDKTKKIAASEGVQLFSQLSYSPLKVEFLHSSKFSETGRHKKGWVSSPSLLHMVKLMNWNSNNHSSNKIFEYSGGISKFNEFFYNRMNFTENDLKFVNGSGQNANLNGTGRIYNEASCATVVRTVKGLKKNLEKQGFKLQDAMAVVGGDMGSTVGGRTYSNPLTQLSVVAKTGTVGTNVTLAGMISAKTGNHFFFFNVETGGPAPKVAKGKGKKRAKGGGEDARCRAIISAKLNQLINKLGGGKPLDYKITYFDADRFEDTGEDTVADSDEVAPEVVAEPTVQQTLTIAPAQNTNNVADLNSNSSY